MLGRQKHDEKCTNKRCAVGCGIVAFHEWLETPVLVADARAADQVRDRFEALKRGNIPA